MNDLVSKPGRALLPVVSVSLLAFGLVQAAAINGAIFTTDKDGSFVNENIYAAKQDVYLNGGPSNTQCKGGALDDGQYFFQVTDPDGRLLLSQDAVWQRKFTVTGGRIATYDGTTPQRTGARVGPCNSVTVQLYPFTDTDNPGGVYKVWITRVSDFERVCGLGVDCGLTGFEPNSSKTDNFKVAGAPVKPGEIVAVKYYDANANGAYDEKVDIPLPNWQMTLHSSLPFGNPTRSTDSAGMVVYTPLVAGNDYMLEESLPLPNAAYQWYHSFTLSSGQLSTQNPAGPLTVTDGSTTIVAFGNYCTVPCGGKTLGYWSNKNGQAETGATQLSALVALNLATAQGQDFDPKTAGAVRTWLLDGNATNMAYMLSVQLAAMQLNVSTGKVNANAYYVPAGRTVGTIMQEANSALLNAKLTLADHAQRPAQEQLKNWLDQLNNNAGVLSPTPCPYAFK